MISSSQEIIWSSSIHITKIILIWCWVELQESVLHELINLHDCCFVTTSVTIVRSGENSDDISIMRPIISIHNQLMCSSYQLKIIRMIKLLTDILSERITSSSWRDTPTTSVIWVRPEKIANRSFSWHFHDSIKLIDLIKSIDGWRKSTMKAENVSLDDSCKWKVIEESCEVLPHVGISVFPQTLIVESINLCDLFGLVITSKDCNSVWISNLEADQKRNSLNRVVPSINVISHEEIVVIW